MKSRLSKALRFLLTTVIVVVSVAAFGACKKADDKVNENDCMLIYFGMEYVGDKQYPTFEYFFPSKEFENTDFAHLVMVYKGEYKDNFKYGDIVTPSIPVDLSKYDLEFREKRDSSMYNPYAEYQELDPATEFTYKGSVFKDMEKKTLIVTKEKYWSECDDGFTTLTMKDKQDRIYSFSYLWRNPEEGRPDILNNRIGDSIEFAVYKNNAVMKLSEGVGLEKGKMIVPDVKTSFNEKEFFVYIGREDGYPVFDYYSPDESGNPESLDCQSVFYTGHLSQSPKYGDVFVAQSGTVSIARTRNVNDYSLERPNRVSYELDYRTELKNIGNGFEILPKKKLVLGSCDYLGFYLFSCILVEPDYTAYHIFDYYSTVNEVNLDGIDYGNQVEFICYKNRLILPEDPGQKN